MWLRQELQTICLKEFTIRHQLDILQDNAYINFNVRHLSTLLFDHDTKTRKWPCISKYCNRYWLNFVSYLRSFPEIYSILVQKDFIPEDPLVIRETNFLSVLKLRIKTCNTFLEICKSITYQGRLRESIARHPDLRELFYILSEKSRLTDPPGHRLLALNNRILFIRRWLVKLIHKHQSYYSLEPIAAPTTEFSILKKKINTDRAPSRLYLSTKTADCDKITKIEDSPVATRTLFPKGSDSNQHLRFIKFKRKPYRLSEIIQSQDSDSTSSADSIWQSPFKRHKPI